MNTSKEIWMLAKEFTFEAAHRLPCHDGKCQRLHGHSWKGIVWIKGSALNSVGPKQGMVTDYSDIKKPMKKLLDDFLDHYYLNDSLKMENPTSENVAKWIYEQLRTELPSLVAVQINETCSSKCIYYPEIDFCNAGIMGGTA